MPYPVIQLTRTLNGVPSVTEGYWLLLEFDENREIIIKTDKNTILKENINSEILENVPPFVLGKGIYTIEII